MLGNLLATKLFVPPARRELVLRERLIQRLNDGLRTGGGKFARKLTLISGPVRPDLLSNAEITQALVASPNTSKTHLRHIYEKLGVRDHQVGRLAGRNLPAAGRLRAAPTPEPTGDMPAL